MRAHHVASRIIKENHPIQKKGGGLNKVPPFFLSSGIFSD